MTRRQRIIAALARLIHLIGDLYNDHKRRKKKQREQDIRDNPDAAWNDRFGVRDDSGRE